ncbi:glycine oxidase ThiO [Blastopirellula sp. JC732]|uniref:Glycine oxidase ThiO n=1 Tax=Blastopirellula sediminis TaxID=2894196 RepID=A0A9X1MUG3_9BACT|nr:glycine oxidase ThiO [Blastopirellula sediminis]MCC9604882.1 glycine oxidase ThiO [Blastopirellula sediminis]MCC9631819.1 glycine oxidase ThiO [Blastopirellula sediminis]
MNSDSIPTPASSSHPQCLIIGGGAIGLSLAYELATHGMTVTVLDKGEVGKAASWAGAGLLPPATIGQAVEPQEQLRALSHQLHAEWSVRLREETGIDNEYERCGGYYLARKVGEAAALNTTVSQWLEEGIAVERITSDELHARLPDLAPEMKAKAAYHLPDEAIVRNPRHLQALQKACSLRGVAFVETAEAIDFELSGDRITAVRTPEARISADQYCIAAGAWSQRLTDALLARVGFSHAAKTPDIEPIRGQMLLLDAGVRFLSTPINEGPRYLVPRRDGLVLVGSTVEEAGFDCSTTVEIARELREFACQLVPRLEAAEVRQSWAGLRPASIDGIPYIGAVPGIANAYAAAGHFRSGLHLSPATAVLLGRLIRGVDVDFDLSPFRLDRS